MIFAAFVIGACLGIMVTALMAMRANSEANAMYMWMKGDRDAWKQAYNELAAKYLGEGEGWKE